MVTRASSPPIGGNGGGKRRDRKVTVEDDGMMRACPQGVVVKVPIREGRLVQDSEQMLD